MIERTHRCAGVKDRGFRQSRGIVLMVQRRREQIRENRTEWRSIARG